MAAIFADRSLTRGDTAVRSLPVAQFVSVLYELKVLPRDKWPTARVVEDMHMRGYARDVFTKASYGAERPPNLTLDECYKWMAHFRAVSLNSIS